MRKLWMRNVCLVLCLALCLGGSAMAAEGKIAMGRYVETPVKLPIEGYISFAQADGAIYVIGETGETMFKSTDLDNWEPIETGHDEKVAPTMGGVNGLAIGEDGTLYLSSGWAMANEERYPYIERIKDGKAERVQLDKKLETGVDRLLLCALPTGELIGLSDTEAYRFSADGKSQQKYAVSGGESIAVHGDELAICSTRNNLITVLDIASGQTLRTFPLPTEAIYGIVGYDANGALYYICSDGLYQVNAGSTMMTQIADGRLMTVSKPSVEARTLLFDKENNPVIVYSNASGSSLVSYHYDEKVATEPSAMLSVFTLYDNQTLRECANKFQQKYPDAMVDIVVALPEGTAITRDDAIRTLNTELLAGKGPDVLVLDGLPVQSYLDKGVLMDLAPAVKPMIDSGELVANMVDIFETRGAIPAVPTRFLLPTLWGDVEGMSSLEDMAAWAKENPDALQSYAGDAESLVGTFYPSCAPAWFTESGRLDEAKIEAFLSALNEIRGKWTYEALVKETGWDIKARMKEYMIAPEVWNPYGGDQFHGTMWESMGSNLLAEGKQKQLPYLSRGFESVIMPNGAMEHTKAGDLAPLPGQAKGCFMPVLMMGASKGTKNGELVLQFVAYALGEEMQDVDLSTDGFPVNTKALDVAQARKQGRMGSFGGGGWSSEWPDQARRDKLCAIIDGLETPVIADFTLYQMIVTESTPFFEGKMDAKQAAQNVCAKANAYLSE